MRKRDMDRDQNLLLGVLAVQLRKVTPSQLVEAAALWATDPSKNLLDRLEEAGHLGQADRDLLTQLANQSIAAHNNDTSAALSAMGGAEIVEASFSGAVKWEATISEDTEATQLVSKEILIERSRGPARGLKESPGRYCLVNEHARGGMGRILHVHDRFLSRDIALKELLPENGGGGDDTPACLDSVYLPHVSRFLQEARVTGQLEHPSIVPVYELGYRHDGTPYYTMKLVRGKTLDNVVKESDSLRDRLRCLPHFLNVCHAVAYAHSRGIIHRDIKPGNTMVGEFGETVVIDWGLAKVRGESDVNIRKMEESIAHFQVDDDSSHATQHGEILGTPCYMAPEQARGEIDHIDERSDVYSLGAMLYAILTGRPPFTGYSPKETLKRVIGEQPPPIRTLAPDAPNELVAICERAMHKKPDERYQSAKELVADIQRFESGALVKAYEYKVTEHFKRFLNRNRAVLVPALAVMAVVLVFAVFYHLQLRDAFLREQDLRQLAVRALNESETSRQTAVLARQRAERENYYATVALSKRNIEELRFNEAEDLLAGCPEEYRHFEWGLLQRLCNLSLASYVCESPLSALAIAPGDALLAAGSLDGRVLLWEPKNAYEPLILNSGDAEIRELAFSPDGRFLAAASADAALLLYDVRAGNPAQRIDVTDGTPTSISFSGDGTLLACGTTAGLANVWAVETGDLYRRFQGHVDDVTAVAFHPREPILATAGRDDTIQIWSVPTGVCLNTLKGHGNDVTSLVFSPDGASLCSGSFDKTVRRWTMPDGRPVSRLACGDAVNDIASSPDGRYVAAATAARTTEVWDIEQNSLVRTLSGHNGAVLSLVFSADNSYVVTASQDATLRVWDALQETRFARMRLALDGPHFAKFAVSPQAHWLVAAGNFGSALVWDFEQNTAARAFHCETVDALELNADASRLLTLRADGTVRIWDALEGHDICTVRHPALFSAAMDREGKRIATGYMDGSIRVQPVPDNGTECTLKGNGSPVTAILFHEDPHYLTSGDLAGNVTSWDLSTSTPLQKCSLKAADVRALVADPEGKRLAIVGGASIVWDWRSGQQVLELRENTSDQMTVAAAWSPDGLRLATAGSDGTVRLWDTSTGHELLSLDAATEFVESLAFNEDGTRLAAVGKGRRAGDTLVMWEVPDWRQEKPVATANTTLWPSPAPSGGDEPLQDAVLRLARTGLPEQPANALDIQEVSLTSDDYRALLEESIELLKENRRKRRHFGQEFRSEGMYLDTGESLLPLTRLGFQPGDIVSTINGARLTSYDVAIQELNRARLDASPQALQVTLWRNGMPMELHFRIEPYTVGS